MDVQNIDAVLREHYDIHVRSIEVLRVGGNYSYAVYGDTRKYFLKIIRPPFLETALQGVDIQMYLLGKGLPVIPIVGSRTGDSYVQAADPGGEYAFVLYDFVEGGEPDAADTEAVGALIGRLHAVMKGYSGQLPVRDRHFFIDRYVGILREMGYPRWERFRDYADAVWEKVKGLPRGYCHGDLYRGNILKSGDALCVVDFDTSCRAFPMYDAALFCNDTDYFRFDAGGYGRSAARLDKFLSGYTRNNALTHGETDAFRDMISLYHFALQATMVELHGRESFSFDFFDNQLDWLMRWKGEGEEDSIV